MADVLPLPVTRTGESAQELLLEQRDVLVRVENVLERSYSRLEIIQDVVAQSLGVQQQQLEMFRKQLENQEFANEEARREAARMRAGGGVGPSGATAETATQGDGPGFGALPALATGAVAGGLAASALRPQIRGLARRLLRGGGLIAIGSIFGETIGNFLGTEAAAILEDLGADPEFANQVGSAISSNAESAIIGAGVSKLLLGRTLPGIIGGIIWNQLDLNRIFTEEGRDELTQGISDWFERARDGELTQEDIITGGLTGAAALYAGRKIQQAGTRAGAIVQRTFPSFNPDGTVQGEGQAARGGNRNTYVRPRRANGQFMSDAEIEEQAKALKSASDRAKIIKLMKGLGALGLAFTVADFGFLIYQLNSATSEAEKQQLVGAWVGQFIGGAAGLAAGAYIGAFGGPWGAVIGGLLGGAAGTFGGEYVGLLIARWAWDEEPPVYQTEEQYQEFIQQNRERFEAGPNVGIYEGITGDPSGAIQRTTPSYAEQYGFSRSAPTVTGTGATATLSPDVEPEITEEQKALVDQITGLMIDLEGLRAEEEIAREQYESSRGRNRRSAETRVDNLTDSIEDLEEEIEGLRSLLEGSTAAPSDVSFTPTTGGARVYNAALGTSMNTGARPIQAAFTPSFGSSNLIRASLSTRGTDSSADIDNILATIRQKESGGDYSALNFAWDEYVSSGGRRGSSATGAYQFIKGTWNNLTDQYGIGQQYEFAKDAPANIQDEVARRYVEDILRRNNGNVGAIPNEWYTGNAAGVMSESQLETNRGMTAAEYQADWLSRYAQIAGGNAPAQIPVPGTQVAQGGDMEAAQSMIGTIGGAIGGYGFDALFGEGTFANILSSVNPEQFIAEKLSGVFNRGQIGVTPAAMELNRGSESATTAPIVVNAPQINNDNSVQASGGNGGRERASQQLAIAPVGEQSATSTMRDWIDATFA